jgi:hypothetical protein
MTHENHLPRDIVSLNRYELRTERRESIETSIPTMSRKVQKELALPS